MKEQYISLLNVIVAAIAVILSLVAVTTARKQQKRSAYFQTQEMLNTEDQHVGRALIYEYTRRGYLPDDDQEFKAILRALNIMNEAAKMVEYGIVPRDWFVAAWHHALREMRVGYDSVVAFRKANWNDWTPYVALGDLITEAEKFRSPNGCCAQLAPSMSQPRLLPRGAPPVTAAPPQPPDKLPFSATQPAPSAKPGPA